MRWTYLRGLLNLAGMITYADRRAFTMLSLAAATDGRKPPITPIRIEKSSAEIIISGVSVNENSSSENEPQFIVETVKNCNHDARNSPMAAPMSEMSIDSVRNAISTLRR